MNTVFSYIVQKRLSQENENIATEALAFIVDSSERGRGGLMKLLRGIAPDLPALRFRTQQTEGTARPDMWGLDGSTPRVFVENNNAQLCGIRRSRYGDRVVKSIVNRLSDIASSSFAVRVAQSA